MRQQLAISVRLVAVAALHFVLIYWLFGSLYGSKPRYIFFPDTFQFGLTLLRLAVPASCVALLIRVLSRGDWVERLMAGALSIVPALVLSMALAECARLFLYALGHG